MTGIEEVMLAVAKAVAVKVGASAAGSVGRAVRRRVFGDPEQKALAAALVDAYEAAYQQHGRVISQHDLTPDFLQYEGAEELALTLVPGQSPDPLKLAGAWVDSLTPRLDIDSRGDRIIELRPVFRTFLRALEDAVGRKRALDQIRGRVHEASTARGVERLVEKAGAAEAGRSDVDQYLRWVGTGTSTCRAWG